MIEDIILYSINIFLLIFIFLYALYGLYELSYIKFKIHKLYHITNKNNIFLQENDIESNTQYGHFIYID
jgi:hypothetical protein